MVVEDRKAARLAAMEAAAKAVAACDEAKVGENDEDIDLGVIARSEAVDALRGMVSAFGPRSKAPAKPRTTLEKADPAAVAEYFASTGLTRKDLADAAKVTTSVIATVQNVKGDRWSVDTFEAKKVLIAAWIESHKDELAARVAAAEVEAAAKAQAEAARQAKRDARSAKPTTPAPKSAAKVGKAASAKAPAKAGRPSPTRRQDNRKPKVAA